MLLAASLSSYAATTRDADSIRRWIEDLEYFRREVPRRHPDPFMNLSRDEFDARVHSLHESLPAMRDDQIVVALSGIVASLGPRNGHTRVVLRTTGTHYLPVSFYAYPDGLFIRTASSDYAALVGMRLIAIGATRADAALAKAESI
ncbi:MAG TPA: hypothetical protein VJ853_12885, partial [Thermoanaerobaculia bacterium]|nr:hypothetical protein [Thermoanaerobaculia bacterium]